jgi:hypothetical protein
MFFLAPERRGNELPIDRLFAFLSRARIGLSAVWVQKGRWRRNLAHDRREETERLSLLGSARDARSSTADLPLHSPRSRACVISWA